MLSTKPIKCLQEVLDWKPPDLSYHKATPYKAEKWRTPVGRKMLMCHDMKGGYLEGESSLEGCENDNEYLFWHWWQVDTFIYFSHHLVTIPPLPWIEAAHKHGVQILGTLITEWEEGSKICSEILKSDESWKHFADQLVEISTFYHFDGWILNIENSLNIQETEIMVKFVEYLTMRMHASLPSCEVLWYDSVIAGGELHWQNELNQFNLDFFKVCDGIFLNYIWNEGNLDASKQCCMQVHRPLREVYVGVDVFGRNCIGCFDSYKSVDLINSKELSTALFAPSWTHEKFNGVHFEQHENRFWSSLKSSFNGRALCRLPLATTFNRGRGKRYSSFGTVLKSDPWFNLSMQSLQALPCDDVTLCQEEAFMGGGCVQVPLKATLQMQLFSMDVDLQVGESLFVSFVSRREPFHPSLQPSVASSFAVSLTLRSLEGSRSQVLTFWDSYSSQRTTQIDDKNMERLKDDGCNDKIQKAGWCLDLYKYNISESMKLEKVGLHVEAGLQGVDSSALLGYLQVSKEESCYLSIDETCVVRLNMKDKGKWEARKEYSSDKFHSFRVLWEDLSDCGMGGSRDHIRRNELQKGLFLCWDFKGSALQCCDRVFNVFVKSSEDNWCFVSFTPISVIRLDALLKTIDGVKEIILKIENHFF